jgi:hypothetical protein
MSDLESEQIKVRYNEATSVSGSAGTKILLKFPKIPGKFLNLASLKLHFTVATSGDSYFDAHSYQSVFQRVRVLSSSNVLMDVTEWGTLYTTIKHTKTNVNVENKQSRLNEGIFANTTEAVAAAGGTKRVSLCFPHGTLLNCDSLLPLDKISGHFQIEWYLQDPKKILFSPTNDATVNYTMSDIMVICDYISSPSLSSYFNGAGVNFHVSNWSHRYQPVGDAKAVLRIPSSFTSLSKLLVLIRDQSRVDSTNTLSTADRQQSFISYRDVQELQFYSSNVPIWSEPILNQNVDTELFDQTLKCFPEIAHSTFHNDVTASQTQLGSVPIGINLQSAPAKFHEQLISGLKSSSHVSDLYGVMSWASGVQYANFAATVFLENDAKIYLDQNGSLQIEF